MRALFLAWPFALAYFLSYALRNVNAVAGPAMQAELGLTAADLGSLSSAYFLVFALMQLPLGALLDRYGPRRVESLLLLVAALGCAVMALGQGLTHLWLGRALVGIGVSACLMGAYKAFRMQHAAELQAGLGSFMLVVGTLGALAVTSPAAWLVDAVGWRGLFWICSGFFLVAAACLRWGVQPLPGLLRTEGGFWSQSIRGIALVMRHREFLRLLPFAVVSYGGYLGISGLWMGPWLRDVLGMPASTAAAALALLMASALGGHLLVAGLAHRWAGAAADRLDRLMHVGMALFLVLCATAVALKAWPMASVGVWAAAFVAAGFTTLAYARIGLCFRPEQSGQATTAINFAIFMGGFLVQWLVGLWESLPQALAGWVALQALALGVLVAFAPRRRP